MAMEKQGYTLGLVSWSDTGTALFFSLVKNAKALTSFRAPLGLKHRPYFIKAMNFSEVPHTFKQDSTVGNDAACPARNY
jgi:hypothetical protein